MSNSELLFSKEQLNRLFPFYILVNENLGLDSCGRSLEKLCSDTKYKTFQELFFIKRPDIVSHDFKNIKELCNQLVVVEINGIQKTVLRGEFEYLESSSQLLFIGSPWFDSMEQVKANNLTVHDFANHDPLIDLLHLIKTQEITNDDLKELLQTVNHQKKALKKAADEVKDIALFPMQNPDPLIRINEEGAIIMKNPAAEKLLSYQYQNKQFNQ